MIEKIGITITMKNCLDYTKGCLESLSRSELKFPYHLILVDHGSTDNTPEFLSEYQKSNPDNTTVLVDPTARSLGELWNKAMEAAKDSGCQANLICNNDILFSKHTIPPLIARLNSAYEVGEDVVIVSATNLRSSIKPEEIYTIDPPSEPSEADSPDFSCFLFTVEGWERMGKFDENYIPCYFEDNDTHTVIKLMGSRAIMITAAPYYHYGSKTQNSVDGGLCTSPAFEANRRYFISKFGMDAGAVDKHMALLKLRFSDATIPGFNERHYGVRT